VILPVAGSISEMVSISIDENQTCPVFLSIMRRRESAYRREARIP